MRPRGFTLLEMIVVLAILGLATALVAPSELRGIDSWKRQAELDALVDQVRALPGTARARGKAILVSAETLASDRPPLRIAPEWTLAVDQPWRVGANGVCEGGRVRVGNAYGSRTLDVAAPFCDPVVRP